MIWGPSVVMSYLYSVISILETVSDIVVFGIIAMELIFGVFCAISIWAKDVILKSLRLV